jgi:hypothetical protein
MAWSFSATGVAKDLGKALKEHAVAETDKPQFEAARGIIEAEMRGYGVKQVLQVRAVGHVPTSPEHDRALQIDIAPRR